MSGVLSQEEELNLQRLVQSNKSLACLPPRLLPCARQLMKEDRNSFANLMFTGGVVFHNIAMEDIAAVRRLLYVATLLQLVSLCFEVHQVAGLFFAVRSRGERACGLQYQAVYPVLLQRVALPRC